MSAKRTALAITGGVAVVAALLLAEPGSSVEVRKASSARADRAAPSSPASRRSGDSQEGEVLDEVWPPPGAVTVEEAALIGSVHVTPEQPCQGDAVRITTDLRRGEEASKVFVDGQPGTTQIVYAEEAGRQRVRVLARSWSDTFERRDVHFVVRQCAGEERLRLRASSRRIAERQYAFSLSGAFDGPVVWEFGDGSSTRTEDGSGGVVHRYAANNAVPQSTYLATATYEGPSGSEEAFVSVTHVEAAGVAARTPYPVVESEGERFVRWDETDGLRTSRFITNELDEDLSFEAVEVRAFPCDGSDEIALQLPAAEVVDESHLAAGQSVDVQVHVPAEHFERPVCQMLVRLAGLAGERLTTSMFAVDTGVPDERVPIEDEELLQVVAAIAAEREVGAPITAEDIAVYRATHGT